MLYHGGIFRYTEGVTVQSSAAKRFARVGLWQPAGQDDILLVYSFAKRYEDMETSLQYDGGSS